MPGLRQEPDEQVVMIVEEVPVHRDRPRCAIVHSEPALRQLVEIDAENQAMILRPVGRRRTLDVGSFDQSVGWRFSRMSRRRSARSLGQPGAGAINVASGYGPWPKGIEMLTDLEASAA